MVIIYTLLLLLIIICGVAIGYIIFYNKLQHYTSKVDQAEAIIDETLRKRFDLVISASKIIQDVVTDKKNLFKDIESLKDENVTNFDMDRKLIDAITLIRQLKSDYKELQDNKEFKEIIKELKATDEKMQAGKVYYNKNTNSLNELVRKFPSNIIAKLHGISIKLFFDGKDMHDDITDDFKL